MSRLILPAALVIIFTVIGFLVGRFGNSLNLNPPQTQNTVVESSANLLFISQTATFQGKIVSVSGKTLQVESDSGQTGELTLSDKTTIYKYPDNSFVASPSSDLKTITTNQRVLIVLSLVENKYQIQSISYFRTER